MTKPLTIEIDEAAAEQLARVAARLGVTPEQAAARAVASSVEAFESSALLARKARAVGREAALAWFRELAAREGWPEPDADDRLPEGYVRGE